MWSGLGGLPAPAGHGHRGARRGRDRPRPRVTLPTGTLTSTASRAPEDGLAFTATRRRLRGHRAPGALLAANSQAPWRARPRAPSGRPVHARPCLDLGTGTATGPASARRPARGRGRLQGRVARRATTCASRISASTRPSSRVRSAPPSRMGAGSPTSTCAWRTGAGAGRTVRPGRLTGTADRPATAARSRVGSHAATAPPRRGRARHPEEAMLHRRPRRGHRGLRPWARSSGATWRGAARHATGTSGPTCRLDLDFEPRRRTSAPARPRSIRSWPPGTFSGSVTRARGDLALDIDADTPLLAGTVQVTSAQSAGPSISRLPMWARSHRAVRPRQHRTPCAARTAASPSTRATAPRPGAIDATVARPNHSESPAPRMSTSPTCPSFALCRQPCGQLRARVSGSAPRPSAST
jgi:hypothetical protein